MESPARHPSNRRFLRGIAVQWWVVTAMGGIAGWLISMYAPIPVGGSGPRIAYLMTLTNDYRPRVREVQELLRIGWTGLLAGGIGAAVVGMAQLIVLTRFVRSARYWVVATAIGGAVGGMAYGRLVYQIPDDLDRVAARLANLQAFAIGGVVAATVAAIGQYMVLRTSFRNATWWLPASTASWAIAWSLAYFQQVQRNRQFYSLSSWAIVWPIGALLTALCFVTLIARNRPDDIRKDFH